MVRRGIWFLPVADVGRWLQQWRDGVLRWQQVKDWVFDLQLMVVGLCLLKAHVLESVDKACEVRHLEKFLMILWGRWLVLERAGYRC